MTSATITTQVDEFNVGFAEQVGPRLAAVFAAEQSDLVSGGVPAAAVTVGATLPDAPLLDPTGASTALYSALGSAPAVIVFYRGAWCPYCNITLKHYQDELLPRLRERGVGLVAISPQTPAGSDAAIANGSLEFTVLSDPANALASSLGILTEPSAEAHLDVADSNADATGAIPHPTVLVVGADRVVRFADVQVDYTRRTEVADILVAVSALD
jgi:peroxiredoxin